jgi:gamma-glutamyltranspeptidase / glutathione hydrolase
MVRSPARLVLALAVILSLPAGAREADDRGSRYTGEHFATRSPVLARNGMAATSHPIASAIAIDIMQQGGSAIDAAIAANAMLALVEPHACGIGGDLFAIVWDPETEALVGYNGSGRTPDKLTRDALVATLDGAERMPLFGPLTVTVPGAVDGWFALHERYGRLPMRKLLAPAIRYAREGIPVTEVDAALWAEALEVFAESGMPAAELAGLQSTFTIDGAAPGPGTIFQNPALAASLELLAEGRGAFYGGDLGARVVDAVQQAGGHLTVDDFEAHRGEWVQPVSVNYRGYDVFELPPNSQGIAALQILNLLEAYPLAALGRDNADFWHLFIESTKLAYEDRAKFYADPDFADPPLEWLLSDAYAGERRRLIDEDRAALKHAAGSPPPHGDTTFLVAADGDGMMVSLIQSNYWEFGSGLVAEGTGFALQNRGAAFSLEPAHANVYAPGKRPFHTIIPAFLMKDGAPLMAFGVMGGYLQPQAHVQILLNIIDFGMNPQEAGDAARVVHSSDSQPGGGRMTDGGVVHMEAGIPEHVVEELVRRGHSVTHGERRYVGSYGGYQAIWRDPDTGVYHGASEMRYDGAAAGY